MRSLFNSLVVVAGIGAALIAAPVAKAQDLFGSDGFTGDLVKIDTVTGVSTLVGPMGIGNGLGVAVNGNTGVAYTRNFTSLYTVNLNTGATALVGASGSFITGLTFDAAFTTLYSVNQSSGEFFTVNPATGAATLVGNTGIGTPLDLSTNAAGVIYAGSLGGNIYTINPLTGAATLVAANVTAGLGLTAISFDAADNLFGVTLIGDRLAKIDLGTATSVLIGPANIRPDIRGLDFIRTHVAAVPEPGVLGLACGAGVSTILIVLRRRRA